MGGRLVPALCLIALFGGCNFVEPSEDDGRPESARGFPQAHRPVAPVISTRWANEESRDRLNEAEIIMDIADVRSGMTVADIGAGEGYYTVRLAKRVGPQGRVLGEDIMPEIIDALARRITRENWENVSVKLGTPDDPRLPPNSFDRIFMVHMYHEISEPYAFLWRLYPALKRGGEVIVVDADRLTQNHGTPPAQLKCEFEAIGFRQIDQRVMPTAGGYMARFTPGETRVDPDRIEPCIVNITDD